MYRDIFQDAELTAALVDALRVLATAVGAARIKDISRDADGKRWAKEFLVGFSLLAIGETRSLLLLLSDRLNLHARIHLRALYEYDLKISLLLEDDDRTLAFRDAFAYEIREFATKLGKQQAEIDAEIERVIGIEDAALVTGTKESRALGGTVKDQMKNELQPEKRYVGTFAWASQVSHGSVLALNELAKMTDGKSDDVLTIAAADNYGNVLLYNALWVVLKFAALVEQEFEIAVPSFQELIDRATAINARLRITTPDQETAILNMREQKLRGRSEQ